MKALKNALQPILPSLILLLLLGAPLTTFAGPTDPNLTSSETLSSGARQILDITDEAALQTSNPEEVVAPEVVTFVKNETLTLVSGKSTYELPLETIHQEYLRNFRELSAANQISFQKNRRLFLEAAVKTLNGVKYGLGFGSVIGSKIMFVKDQMTSLFKQKTEQLLQAQENQNIKESFQSRSERVTAQILAAIDNQLWMQSQIVSASNEFGVVLAVGLQAETGGGSKGIGGTFELGINIGYNKDTKAAVFQIYRSLERFKSAPLKLAASVGLTGKMGVMISKTSQGLETQTLQGESIYPPGPVYSQSTPSRFSAGLSSVIVGVPPPPFDSLVSFVNKLDQKTWLRISISPILKGFVRVQLGLNGDSMRFFLQPITKILAFFRRSFGSGLCAHVYVQ